MTNAISMKVAARRLLTWNLKGLALGGIPRRGVYLQRFKDPEVKGCMACKVGLVMLGRYGRATAMSNNSGPLFDASNEDLRMEVQAYGPTTTCPVRDCHDKQYLHEGSFLGSVTEHLFEIHKWSVARIDKWLAGLADVDLEEYQGRYGQG